MAVCNDVEDLLANDPLLLYRKEKEATDGKKAKNGLVDKDAASSSIKDSHGQQSPQTTSSTLMLPQ